MESEFAGQENEQYAVWPGYEPSVLFLYKRMALLVRYEQAMCAD